MPIAISPGGGLGLYMLGTMVYIKRTYQIEKYNIGGTSAGALVSLYAAKYGNHLPMKKRSTLSRIRRTMEHYRIRDEYDKKNKISVSPDFIHKSAFERIIGTHIKFF